METLVKNLKRGGTIGGGDPPPGGEFLERGVLDSNLFHVAEATDKLLRNSSWVKGRPTSLLDLRCGNKNVLASAKRVTQFASEFNVTVEQYLELALSVMLKKCMSKPSLETLGSRQVQVLVEARKHVMNAIVQQANSDSQDDITKFLETLAKLHAIALLNKPIFYKTIASFALALRGVLHPAIFFEFKNIVYMWDIGYIQIDTSSFMGAKLKHARLVKLKEVLENEDWIWLQSVKKG
jgi:hypothetical protein